jgi:NADH dehydrogenase
MKIVVTGGSGLIGTAAIDELIRRGHHIRLLSRHAEDDVKRWPERVEAWNGNVADASTIARSCEGYDAVLHIAGIAQEEPPDLTFDAVNVDGTRNIVREADRAVLRRFVYVSSLGADRGQSDYHRSKRAAERIVGEFSGEWLIVRPGNVYGPGDGIVSLLLEAARALPAVAVIDGGDQMFQPIWHADLGRALAAAVERHDLHATAYEVAGNDLTSMNHILERLGEITGRSPERIPVPGALAKAGASIASALGVRSPVTAECAEPHLRSQGDTSRRRASHPGR